MKQDKKPWTEAEIPPEVQFKLALDYLYREANFRGWDLTANLIGAASDSIVADYYASTDDSDLESCDGLFFVPNNFGAKPN